MRSPGKSTVHCLLAAFAALAMLASAARASEPELSFVVVGDWGQGNSAQRGVAAELGRAAEAIHSRFVISTGDNFYPDGVASRHDQKWEALFEDVYTAPSLMTPWRVVLGNHDHQGSVSAQIKYHELDRRWTLPAPYYKHSETIAAGIEADFFFLDTTPLLERARWPWKLWPFESEQYAWLKRELAASTASWKIVVGHHPVFSGGKHGNTPVLIEHLKPLFEKFGIDAYINGHNHSLEHVVVNGVNYLTVGASANATYARSIDGTRFVRGAVGFMTAKLHREDLLVEFFDENGVSMYQAEIWQSRQTVLPANPRP